MNPTTHSSPLFVHQNLLQFRRDYAGIWLLSFVKDKGAGLEKLWDQIHRRRVSVPSASGLYFNSHSDFILAPGKERPLSVSMVTSYLNSDGIIKVAGKRVQHNFILFLVEKNPLYVFGMSCVANFFQFTLILHEVYSSARTRVITGCRDAGKSHFCSCKFADDLKQHLKAKGRLMIERIRQSLQSISCSRACRVQESVNGMDKWDGVMYAPPSLYAQVT